MIVNSLRAVATLAALVPFLILSRSWQAKSSGITANSRQHRLDKGPPQPEGTLLLCSWYHPITLRRRLAVSEGSAGSCAPPAADAAPGSMAPYTPIETLAYLPFISSASVRCVSAPNQPLTSALQGGTLSVSPGPTLRKRTEWPSGQNTRQGLCYNGVHAPEAWLGS